MVIFILRFYRQENGKKTPASKKDTSGLIDALRESELVGIISSLYGILLHQGSLSRGSVSPLRHSVEILSVVSSAIKLLVCFAKLDLKSFQVFIFLLLYCYILFV